MELLGALYMYMYVTGQKGVADIAENSFQSRPALGQRCGDFELAAYAPIPVYIYIYVYICTCVCFFCVCKHI